MYIYYNKKALYIKFVSYKVFIKHLFPNVNGRYKNKCYKIVFPEFSQAAGNDNRYG